MGNRNFYEVLGVSKGADADQIKAAYREKAIKYHPDKNVGNEQAAEKMKAVNEAYAVLSDDGKRRDYDLLQRQYGFSKGYEHFRNKYSQNDIFAGSDIHKVFDELARSFGFRNFNEIAKEFYSNNKQFHFKTGNADLKGAFFFGAFSLSKMNAGTLLGKAAQTLLQNFSQTYIRHEGNDLRDTITISAELAEKGGPFAYYHKWRSKKLIVKIPPGTRQGQQIRLSGMGEKTSGKSGDLYLKVDTKPSLINKLKKFLPF